MSKRTCCLFCTYSFFNFNQLRIISSAINARHRAAILPWSVYKIVARHLNILISLYHLNIWAAMLRGSLSSMPTALRGIHGTPRSANSGKTEDVWQCFQCVLFLFFERWLETFLAASNPTRSLSTVLNGQSYFSSQVANVTNNYCTLPISAMTKSDSSNKIVLKSRSKNSLFMMICP